MKPTRLHHVSLNVTDIERSRRFYTEVLGLEEVDRPDFGVPGAWLQVGDGQVHLIVAPESADIGRRPGQLTPMAPHAALAIEDYDTVREELVGHGVELLESAQSGQMWVRDPDGNVIELSSA